MAAKVEEMLISVFDERKINGETRSWVKLNNIPG